MEETNYRRGKGAISIIFLFFHMDHTHMFSCMTSCPSGHAFIPLKWWVILPATALAKVSEVMTRVIDATLQSPCLPRGGSAPFRLSSRSDAFQIDTCSQLSQSRLSVTDPLQHTTWSAPRTGCRGNRRSTLHLWRDGLFIE